MDSFQRGLGAAIKAMKESLANLANWQGASAGLPPASKGKLANGFCGWSADWARQAGAWQTWHSAGGLRAEFARPPANLAKWQRARRICKGPRQTWQSGKGLRAEFASRQTWQSGKELRVEFTGGAPANLAKCQRAPRGANSSRSSLPVCRVCRPPSGKLFPAQFASLPGLPAPFWQTFAGPVCQFAKFARLTPERSFWP